VRHHFNTAWMMIVAWCGLQFRIGATMSLPSALEAPAMARVYNHKDMEWNSHELRLTTGRLLATVKPDPDWPGLWRAHMADGHVTDMVNLSRAKDAASILALAALNASPEETVQERAA
jgi:hypothetical protein